MVDFVCKESYNLNDYIDLMAYLRSERGCPWDRQQTHESIKRNLLEEAYETYEAIEEGDSEHLCEELGDLLMQVLFHAQMEKESGGFDINAVADAACKKLVHRHPHVFADVSAVTADKVLDNWEKIKRGDRAQETVASVMDGVPKALPALSRIEKIQHKAAKQGFDWPVVQGAMEKLREETDELQQGIDADDLPNIEEEIGDALFSVVNVARFYGIDPENAARKACEKFIRRFRYLENGAAKLGRPLSELSLFEMEEIYQQGRHDLEGKEPVPVKR
ncbi:MAG: nucleoside triphosphate pyrophosphohydrolase [Oscillospiraceae bacterium]